MNPKTLIHALLSLILATLAGAHDWHGSSALDADLLSQRPLSEEERAEPAAGCVPLYCLREIEDLTETLARIERSLPDGPEGRANKWFATVTRAREDVARLSKSLSTEDCLTLAGPLGALIGGFERADSGFPLTPEYAACVPAGRKVGVTMNQAVRRHLDNKRWTAIDADRPRLCLASLLSNPNYNGRLPDAGYTVTLRDLFLLFPSEVVRFMSDSSNREIIGHRYPGWQSGQGYSELGFRPSMPERAPAAMKHAAADPKEINIALPMIREAINRQEINPWSDSAASVHLPGKLSKIEQRYIHGIQKNLALQLAENSACSDKMWYSAAGEWLQKQKESPDQGEQRMK